MLIFAKKEIIKLTYVRIVPIFDDARGGSPRRPRSGHHKHMTMDISRFSDEFVMNWKCVLSESNDCASDTRWKTCSQCLASFDFTKLTPAAT